MKKTFFILFLLLFPFISQAHLAQQSTSQLKVEGNKLEWTLQVHQNNFEEKFKAASTNQIKDFISSRVKFTTENQDCVFQTLDTQTIHAEEKTVLTLQLHCPKELTHLDISFGFFWGDVSHQHLMNVSMFEKNFSHTFSSNDSEWVLSFSKWKIFLDFLKTGFLHIWAGLDHLLFVFTLVLAARKSKELIYLVTSFTLAHSLSLALATFDLFNLSPSIVEPLIAVTLLIMTSIDYFKIKGIQGTRLPLLITFIFGLIHGLAFSEVLKETHLQGWSLALPLFSFNLGVELAQLLVVFPLFFVLHFLQKYSEKLSKIIKKIILIFISLLSAYWLWTRVFEA